MPSTQMSNYSISIEEPEAVSFAIADSRKQNQIVHVECENVEMVLTYLQTEYDVDYARTENGYDVWTDGGGSDWRLMLEAK